MVTLICRWKVLFFPFFCCPHFLVSCPPPLLTRCWLAPSHRLKLWRGLCDIYSVLCYFIPLPSHSHSPVTNNKRIRFTAKQGCLSSTHRDLWSRFFRFFADIFVVPTILLFCCQFFIINEEGCNCSITAYFFFFTFGNIFNFCRTTMKRWKIKMEQIWHRGLYIYIYILYVHVYRYTYK